MRPIEIIPQFLIPVAVGAGFAFLRRYVPAVAERDTLETQPIEELNARFRYTQWYFGLALVFVGVAFAWITYQCLFAANRYFAASEGPSRFQLLPQKAMWWFFPGFGALVLSWDLTLFLWATFGNREDAALYVHWNDQRVGFDSRKAFGFMGLFIALPIGVLTVLALPMHTTLHEEDMHIRGYASMRSTVYRYSDARRITIVDGLRDRSGKFTPRAAIIIDFADGRRWSSATNRDFVRTPDPALAAFIQQKTGLTFGHVETESEIAR
jgi:hypothetical protein